MHLREYVENQYVALIIVEESYNVVEIEPNMYKKCAIKIL